MIEKILGVVCLVAAGGMYTAERLSMINQQHDNGYVWALTILGALFMLAATGRRIWGWIKWLGTDSDLEEQRLADHIDRTSDS